MTPWEVIERLYDSEINAGLKSDWDGGITAWIAGGHTLAERTFLRQEFDEIADWLDREARRLFPASQYARREIRRTHETDGQRIS
jgi:hypothetical protein